MEWESRECVCVWGGGLGMTQGQMALLSGSAKPPQPAPVSPPPHPAEIDQ